MITQTPDTTYYNDTNDHLAEDYETDDETHSDGDDDDGDCDELDDDDGNFYAYDGDNLYLGAPFVWTGYCSANLLLSFFFRFYPIR